MKLAIVIPAFNEAPNIRQTIQELLEATDRIPEIHETKVIVADDHSSDHTFETVNQFHDPRVCAIRLSRRGGSHIAIRAAFHHAQADAVFCISADGQDDSAKIKEMLTKWKNGSKIIWALRKNRNIESFFYRACAYIFYHTLNLLVNEQDKIIDQSRADFFLLDKMVVDAINSCQEHDSHLFGLLNWLGFEQDYIEYDRKPRRSGKSKWGFWGALKMAKLWVTTFSGLPLRLISYLGFMVAVLGLGYGVHVVLNVYFGQPAPGWSSIMCAILLLGGVQMILLGVMGEYIWRNLEESRRRPIFFIEKRTANL